MNPSGLLLFLFLFGGFVVTGVCLLAATFTLGRNWTRVVYCILALVGLLYEKGCEMLLVDINHGASGNTGIAAPLATSVWVAGIWCAAVGGILVTSVSPKPSQTSLTFSLPLCFTVVLLAVFGLMIRRYEELGYDGSAWLPLICSTTLAMALFLFIWSCFSVSKKRYLIGVSALVIATVSLIFFYNTMR